MKNALDFNSRSLEVWKEIDPENWQKLAGEIISVFLENGPMQFEDLNFHWKSRDFEKVARIAHILKSSCGNVGLDKSSLLFNEIEQTLLSKNLEMAKVHIKAQNEIFHKSVSELRRYIKA